MNNIEFKTDEGNYPTRAHSFTLADDLYLFFRFESPKSDCEIGIAYDVYVDGGYDWYVNDGTLGGQDHEIVNDLIWNRLAENDEWRRFRVAVDAAVREFNGLERA